MANKQHQDQLFQNVEQRIKELLSLQESQVVIAWDTTINGVAYRISAVPHEGGEEAAKIIKGSLG